MTSVSVVVFFRRTRLDTRPWNTLIAPTLAAVLIAVLAVLVLANFDLLTGGSGATALSLILSVPAVLLIGVAIGRAGAAQRSATEATASGAADQPASATTSG